MQSFRFESWPWLLGIPLTIAMVLWVNRRMAQPRVVFSSLNEIRHAPITWTQRLKAILPWFHAIGLILLFVGMARPQWGRSESRVSGNGIAIQLVLDVSGSMEAIDFELNGKNVNRLKAVKHVVSQFVLGSRSSGLTGRRDDLVGLVAFGGFADSKCPLTLDHGALVDNVESLDTPKKIRDRRGRVINEESYKEELATAIGDGLALGLSQLKESKSKSKVVILLTDGDSNAGVIDPREAAMFAKEMGIKVYTIGIGTDGIVPFPQEDEFGRVVLTQARFRTNEDLLKDIAKETGGTYFHASSLDGLSTIYGKIDAMEKSQLEETKFSQYNELFPWFLVSSLALLGLGRIMTATRFRTMT
jgi:Ca-activated chloride channel homolog